MVFLRFLLPTFLSFMSFLSYAQEIKSEPLCKSFLAVQAEQSQKINQMSAVLSQLEPAQPSLSNYNKVRSVWIELTDLVYTAGSFEESAVKKTFSESKQPSSKTDLCISSLEKNESKIKTKALKAFVKSSKIRTREINFQKTQNETVIFRWTNDYFKDHLLEIKVIPLRWVAIFTSKFDRFANDLDSGVEGWIRVGQDLFLLILFLFSLMAFVWGSLRFNTFFSGAKAKFLRSLYSNKKTRKFRKWVEICFPYIPWVLLVVFVQIEQRFIVNTYFSDLNIFFPYVAYFAYYKIFHIFVSQILVNFLSYAKTYDVENLRAKISKTADWISQFVIWSMILLHTADSAVGRGFVYTWIDKIFFLGLMILFVTESKNWESEIESMLKTIVPDEICTKLVSFSNKLSIFRSSFLLIAGIFAYLLMLLYGWLKTLEIFKTLSARVFRERVKIASQKTHVEKVDKRSKDYGGKFLLNSFDLEVASQDEILDKILSYAKLKESESQSRNNTAIVGPSGFGKTHLLNLIEKNLGEGFEVKTFSPSNRRGAKNILDEIKIKIEEQTKEAVFLLDNLHFFFLSKVGGFKEIKELFTLIDNSPDNISWVVSIDNNSWNYLDAILNKTSYFSTLYNLEKWSEAEVKSLILKKHEPTGYALSFSNILAAMKSDNFYEDKKYVEEKYFRILWEESLGNPVVAQVMWINSLEASGMENKLNVGIPHSRFETLLGLPNDFYFVLASIVLHVEIDVAELSVVNDSDLDFIRNVIEFCENKGYIEQSGNTIKLAPLWRNNVISILTGKNYIYGK